MLSPSSVPSKFTHDHKQVPVKAFGDHPDEPKVSAYSKQFADPKRFSQKDAAGAPAGKPSEIIAMYGGKQLPIPGEGAPPAAPAGKSSLSALGGGDQ